MIDPTAAWKEPTRTAETLLRAEPAAVASELAARLAAARSAPARDEDAAWASGWAEADRVVRGAVSAELAALESLSEPGVWPVLAAVLADGDQVLAASSMPVRDMEGFLPLGSARVRFISNRGANGIDGLVSTAAGAAASGARTWAVIGDLALAHDLGGLAAASRAPSLRLIVVDNGGGGIFHFLPQADAMDRGEFEALLGTPSGLDLERAAALFGIEAATPGTPGELETRFAGDAGMVVVRTDRDQNLALHRRLADAAAAALASA